MKKNIFIFSLILLTMVSCSLKKSDGTDLSTNIKNSEFENTEDQLPKGMIGYPNEVITLAESLVKILEERSGIDFTFNAMFARGDADVGDCYDIMYYATQYDYKEMQFRLLIDSETYKLGAICIIRPVPDDVTKTPEFYDLYYNRLWPAFNQFDFDKLFEHKPYRLTEESDDNIHSENMYNTEYILDTPI